jgi:glycine/D-amino acid oxidase-like deaminating enzyme
LRGADIAHTEVAAADVGKWFPGLRPTDADAVWQATAGTLFADVALQAHLQLFEQHGGRLLAHTRLVDIEKRHTGVRLSIQRTGMALATLDVDTVVLALGPWTPQFLARLGVDVVLEPVLEQVSYFDGAGFDGLPGFYDGPTESEPGLYSMPVPGVGYKVGLDQSIATFIAADLTRTPNAAMTHDIEARVSRDFDGLVPRATKSLVCSWTDSPDGRFIIDRVWDDHVVLACGDSGAGFKWSAFMGQVLADMAEGKAPDSDVATFGLARLANYDPTNHPVKFLQ